MIQFFTRSLLAVLVAWAAIPGSATARPLAIGDMARIVVPQEPAISPDGRTVALILVRSDVANASYANELVLLDARTGVRRASYRLPDVSVPRWSPEGSRLAFLARPKAGEPLQAYIAAPPALPRQMTHAPGDVVDAAWSPDGRTLAFAAYDPAANAAALARHHDYFFAGDNDYTATAAPVPLHLWRVPAAGGAAHRLTSGSWTIAPTDPGGIFSPQIAWSPDGRRIALTRVATPYTGEDEYSTIWIADAATGAMHKLTAHPDVELSPSFSPDGRHLAYWWARAGDFTAENSVRVVTGANDEMLAPSLDANIGGALWFPDSQRMLLCGTVRTRGAAWIADLRGGVRELPLGDLNVVCDSYQSSTFDSGIAAGIARDGTIAFLGDDASHARELYVLAPGAAAPRRLTHYNDWLGAVELGAMRELDWNGPNGFAENGVVTYPPGFDRARIADPSRLYPAVLLIHGGPGLASLRAFASEDWPLAQAIAARGYVVFQPNYRGSDGAGNAYMIAIDGDSAAGPASDIMAGLAALESKPGIDAHRIAVSGWSYGGLLTTWLIGHSHDFRAAISGAAVNNETDEYDLSTSNVQDRYLLGASPYRGDGARIYAEQSPISYYRDITTPTLIWATTLDPVVPIPQSYELYHALRENGVPVRLLVFPASTHGPSNPVQTADLTRFWIQWLDQHL